MTSISVEHWNPREVPVLITVVCKKFEIGKYKSSSFVFFLDCFGFTWVFKIHKKFRILLISAVSAIGIFLIGVGFNLANFLSSMFPQHY